MNWVEGLTLTGWINKHIGDTSTLEHLAQRFDALVQSMIFAHMAHGDLQHGNLLVDDAGNLHLVDYDGMYVPGLEALASDEVGHPNYQPPGRSQSDYGPAMDRFSAWLISLSLKAIAVDTRLWDRLNPDHEEYLLLNKRDFVSANHSSGFSALASHPNGRVRELETRIRYMLPVPLASMPAPVPVDSTATTSRTPFSPAPKITDGASGGGVPSWMAGHVKQSTPASAQAGSPPTSQRVQGPYDPPIRSLRWLVRTLIVLPIAILGTMAWNPLLGMTSSACVGILSVIVIGILFLHGSLNREFSEARHDRKLAAIRARSAKHSVAQTKRQAAKVEQDAKRLSGHQNKKRNGVQTSYTRRLQEARRPQEAVDRQLKRLEDRKHRERTRRLKEIQQEYVHSRLSAATIEGSHISGIGAQLVSNLRSVGIRTAADFTGVRLIATGGRTTVAQFQLRRGGLVRVSGIGEVKARRIEQWRQSQVTYALQRQPTTLPPPELAGIEARFATEERQLNDERVRVASEIANQIASINRELGEALAALDKDQAAERVPIDQRRAATAAQLSQAIADELSADRSLQDSATKLAATARPSLHTFMASVLRG